MSNDPTTYLIYAILAMESHNRGHTGALQRRVG